VAGQPLSERAPLSLLALTHSFDRRNLVESPEPARRCPDSPQRLSIRICGLNADARRAVPASEMKSEPAASPQRRRGAARRAARLLANDIDDS
jgi:hypothetical protein